MRRQMRKFRIKYGTVGDSRGTHSPDVGMIRKIRSTSTSWLCVGCAPVPYSASMPYICLLFSWCLESPSEDSFKAQQRDLTGNSDTVKGERCCDTEYGRNLGIRRGITKKWEVAENTQSRNTM